MWLTWASFAYECKDAAARCMPVSSLKEAPGPQPCHFQPQHVRATSIVPGHGIVVGGIHSSAHTAVHTSHRIPCFPMRYPRPIKRLPPICNVRCRHAHHRKPYAPDLISPTTTACAEHTHQACFACQRPTPLHSAPALETPPPPLPCREVT